MKKKSPDTVTIYHKNPKVKVSDVLTGFCRAAKFCDGHRHTLSVSNSTEVENSSDNNDNVNTINNNNNNNNNNKSHDKQGEKKSKDIEIKQAKISKQIIMAPQH